MNKDTGVVFLEGRAVDMKELKGLEIAARARLTFKNGVWLVPSQTNQRSTYSVTLDPLSCSCQDFELEQRPCKHVHAARLVQERDHGGRAPVIDMEAVPRRPTYKQNWVAYNEAQRHEKKRFQILLHDLCQGIAEPERPPTRGPRPHLFKDAVFAMVFKIYSTFSSRRFSCDLADAHERGHTVNLIPGMKCCNFLESKEFTPILHNLITQSSLPLRMVETTFAPDSSGFSTSRFIRWHDEKYGVTRSGKHWIKAHIMTGVKTNTITAVEIHDRDANDAPLFKPLLEATAKNFTVESVPADKGYLSRDNLMAVHELGATPYIPFKVNSQPGEPGSLWNKLYGYYQFQREEFLKFYHARSNVESTFSMVKAKFRDHVRSKSEIAMRNEVLCKFLAHNLCVLIQSQCELGIEPVFWKDDAADKLATGQDVLEFPMAGG
jgi:transposase